MSLNPRVIALQGIGAGLLALALQGVTPDDASAGGLFAARAHAQTYAERQQAIAREAEAAAIAAAAAETIAQQADDAPLQLIIPPSGVPLAAPVEAQATTPPPAPAQAQERPIAPAAEALAAALSAVQQDADTTPRGDVRFVADAAGPTAAELKQQAIADHNRRALAAIVALFMEHA